MNLICHQFRALCLLGILTLNGCGSGQQMPLPQPVIVDCPKYGIVETTILLKGSTADLQDESNPPFHWRVSLNNVIVFHGHGHQFTFTPKRAGDHVVQLSCDKTFDGSSLTSAKVSIETSEQRDARMTKEIAGSWRFSTEEETLLLRLHPHGKLNLRSHVNAGGFADALASAAQNDMGEINGEWWVSDGKLCLRITGVESALWTVWLRAVDSVTGGDLGKLLVCKTTVDGDTMLLQGDFTEGVVRKLTRVKTEK